MINDWRYEVFSSGGTYDNPIDLYEVVTHCGSKRICEAVELEDARLICAAPRMRKTLEACRKWVAVYKNIDGHSAAAQSMLRMIDEALNLAKGD